MIDNEGKEHMDRVEVDDRRKRLSIVDPISLREALSDRANFVMSDGVIRVILEGKHSLGRHNVSIGRVRNQLSYPLNFQHSDLCIYGCLPHGYLCSLNG